jgi:mono/diheme cytochrome c family protein
LRSISVFAVWTAFFLPMVASAQTLSPGQGADVVEDNCQNCHGLDRIISTHHDADGWREVVADMIGRGASLTDDQEQQIVAYLASHYGASGSTTPTQSK